MRSELGQVRPPEGAQAESGLRPVVSSLLRYGVLLSALTMLVGLLMLFIQLGPKAFVSMPQLQMPEGTDLTSLRAVLRELLPPEPEAVMDAGVLLLIATPAVTVGASAVAYALEGDRLYAVIATIVFAMLMLGFAIGRGIAIGG
jgi:uncharacterized membrane protein